MLHILFGIIFSLYVSGANMQILPDGTFFHRTTYSELTGTEHMKLMRLISWITDNGGFVSETATLGISNENGYRGVFAVKDIPKGTVLARIPPGTIIRDGQDVVDWVGQGSIDTTRGILSLAREKQKGASSHFYPWLNILPTFEDYALRDKHPKAVLLAATGNAQRALLVQQWNDMILDFGNKVYQRVEAFDAFVESCLEWNAKAPLFPTDIFSAEITRFVFMTRYARWWSNWQTYLPYVDMFNHSGSDNHVDLLKDGDDWIMVATADVKAGQELFHGYGVHDHQEMFAVWGFCEWTRKIKFKTVPPIVITKYETVIGRAISFLTAKQEEQTLGRYFFRSDGMSLPLWRMLRTLSLDARDLSLLLLKSPDDPAATLDREFVSLDNELSALGKAITLVKQSRAEFPKTKEEYRTIAADTDDHLLAMLAKIVLDEIKLLESLEKTIRKIWDEKIQVD